MQTFGIDTNNDLYLNSSGNIVVKTDIDAMADIYTNKAQTNLGECLFNQQKGIDFFNTIFSSPAFLDLFQNELLNQIEDTAATQKVTNYEAEAKNGVYAYTMEIQTDYGQVALNG